MSPQFSHGVIRVTTHMSLSYHKTKTLNSV